MRPVASRPPADDAGTRGAFAEVRVQWQQLGSHASYFLQTPEWVEPLSEKLDAGVVWGAVDNADGRPAAVAAVRRSARSGLTVLSQVRVGAFALPYLDGLLDPEAFGPRGLSDLAGIFAPWHILWLFGLRQRSPWLQSAATSGSAHVRAEPSRGVGVLDTSMARQESGPLLPRNMRDSLRKARRRMAARGGAQFAVTTGSGVAEAFERHVAMEALGWKGPRGYALAETTADREQLREYLAACDSAQVRTLHIDGRLAASQLATTVARTLFLHQIAYDEQVASLSPGNLLMADLVESCCGDPAIDRIDCLVWQPWHQRWGMVREPTYSLAAFNTATARGIAARAARGPAQRLIDWRERRWVARHGDAAQRPTARHTS